MPNKSMIKRRLKVVKSDCRCHHWHHDGGGIYGLGFIGAAIYYISTATSFWSGVLGILKAIVWPAFVVFGALKSFGI